MSRLSFSVLSRQWSATSASQQGDELLSHSKPFCTQAPGAGPKSSSHYSWSLTSKQAWKPAIAALWPSCLDINLLPAVCIAVTPREATKPPWKGGLTFWPLLCPELLAAAAVLPSAVEPANLKAAREGWHFGSNTQSTLLQQSTLAYTYAQA